MKIFARKRLWLLAIPLLLASFGLWRVREARTWVPRVGPLYSDVNSSPNIIQLPLLWRANSANSFAEENKQPIVNWNRVPIALHFPEKVSSVVKTVSSDGSEVLKVNSKTLELWRAGKKRVTRKTDAWQPSALAISPNGARWAVATHSYNFPDSFKDKDDFSLDSVALWDAQTKSQTARLNAKLGNVTALSFSPDSRLLAAVAADGWAFVWNADDGKLVRKWRAHPWVAATVEWSPDGKTLLTGANPRLGEAMNWTISIANGVSLSGGGGIFKGHIGDTETKRELNAKVDAQNNLTINGQTDRSLRLWDVQSGKLLRKWESVTGICSAQFSPDGRELAVGTHGEALVFDAATLKIARRLPMKDYPQWPASVAWAPDGNTLAVACAPQLWLWRAH